MSLRGLAGLYLLAVVLPLQGPTSGSITGRVTDSSGGVLPGVTVKLSGPALQGLKTAATDAEGIYRLQDVPPGGDYKIEAGRQGLQTVTQSALQVLLGQSLTIDLVLAPGPVTEAITVTAASPRLDLTATTTGAHVKTEQFLSLPSARSFQYLTTLAPGVSLEMGDHDRRLAGSPTVGASSAPENNYIIDGLSTTDPRYGISGANLTINFVQEVQVLTAGYPAEYGRSTGAVFNVITKAGSNAFQGDLFGYFRGKALTPADVERRSNKSLVTFADRVTGADAGASAGGPLSRDRIWFFAAFNPVRQTTTLGGRVLTGLPLTAANRAYDGRAEVYTAKVTWALAPAQSLVVSAFGDPARRTGWLAGPAADAAAALRTEKSGGHNVSVRYSGVAGSLAHLEITGGRHDQRATLDPATAAGNTVPRQIDETLGGFERGGFQRHQDDRATRDAFTARVSTGIATHDLRAGVDVEVNTYDAAMSERWFRFFGPELGFNTYVQERNDAIAGRGRTTNTAVYVQDSWRVRPNLRINAGLRFDHERLTSSNGVQITGAADAAACTGSAICRNVSGFAPGGILAPRVGFVWDPTRKGLFKVTAFWGRFHESIPLDLNLRALNGEQHTVTQDGNAAALTPDTWFNPSGSPLAINTPWTVNQVFTLMPRTPIDEGLKSQFEDQFVVGGEYQLRGGWTIGARYVDRSLKRVIEGVGAFADPANPFKLTGFVIANPGLGMFGAPFQPPVRHYRAVEVTVQRMLAHNWSLTSSFVSARSTGNYEGLYQSGNSELDPNFAALYDVPSFIPNSQGRLRADRPYQIKVHTTYTTKWGLTISEGLFASAGTPISALGPEIVDGYGDGTVFMLPRGSAGRTPGYWSLDLHADYRLPIALGPHRSLGIVLDVFNAFNRHAVLEQDEQYIYEGMPGFETWRDPENLDVYGNPKYDPGLPRSPFFRTPTLFQAPRTIQIGVRFSF